MLVLGCSALTQSLGCSHGMQRVQISRPNTRSRRKQLALAPPAREWQSNVTTLTTWSSASGTRSAAKPRVPGARRVCVSYCGPDLSGPLYQHRISVHVRTLWWIQYTGPLPWMLSHPRMLKCCVSGSLTQHLSILDTALAGSVRYVVLGVVFDCIRTRAACPVTQRLLL